MRISRCYLFGFVTGLGFFTAYAITSVAQVNEESVLAEEVLEVEPTLAAPELELNNPAGHPVAEEVYSGEIPAESVVIGEPIETSLPAIECLRANVTNYKYRLRAKRYLRCQEGAIETILMVENPAEHCSCCYTVDISMPVCCVGQPRVHSRRGLLGRGIVTYQWPCGWEAKIIFRARGDVVVHYDAN